MSLDLVRPLVYLITSGECETANYDAACRHILDLATVAAETGIDLIQVREKRLTGKLLLDLTQRVVEITRDSQTKVLVNDRLDTALAARADGVHLTPSSVDASVVRAHAPEGFLIGVSCHSVDEIKERTAGADFALFGPVFASPGKGDGVGPASLLAAVERADGFPVLAIGGINYTNYRSVLDAGAAGFAAIRALNDASSLRHILKELRR